MRRMICRFLPNTIRLQVKRKCSYHRSMLMVLNPRLWERHKVYQLGPCQCKQKRRIYPHMEWNTIPPRETMPKIAGCACNSYQAPIPCHCAQLHGRSGPFTAPDSQATHPHHGLWISVPMTPTIGLRLSEHMGDKLADRRTSSWIVEVAPSFLPTTVLLLQGGSP